MNLINLTGADAKMVCLKTPIVSALQTTWCGQPNMHCGVKYIHEHFLGEERENFITR